MKRIKLIAGLAMIALYLTMISGCRTTHHFRTETLKHSSYNTDTITLEVAEW
jgi:hypothetical protein